MKIARLASTSLLESSITDESSPSSLNVSFTAAVEANMRVALSATKWTFLNGIWKWVERCGMLVSVIAADSCRTLVFCVKILHSIGTGRSPGSSAECKSLLNVMLYFLRSDFVWSLKHFFCPQILLMSCSS